MLGVVAFQTYWLYENHKNELSNFKHDLYRSLSSASNAELDQRIDKVVRVMGGNNHVFRGGKNGGNKRRKYGGRGNGYNKNYRNNEFVEAEPIVVNGIDDSVVDQKYWDSGEISDNNFDLRKRRMDRVFLSIMSNMDEVHKLPEEKFDTKKFNEVFREELNKRGIDIDYKLALIDKQNNIILNFNEEISESELREATFLPLRHSTFPQAKLAVLFPSKAMYIISKNAILSITSLLLILLSIGSMIYIIKQFFSQKRISEIRRDFMNNMTHELKTPISTVGLALEAMQNFKILDNPKRTEQYIGIARKENHRLGMLVEKVLKMSAYERENIQMKWETLNGDVAVEEVITDLTFQIENQGGSIFNEMNAENVLIKVDKLHFTNVIYNLVDNAIKYSNGKPEIFLKSYVKESHWFIEISDKGVGIPLGYQNKIFEKFFRVPSGNIHNVKGYGLGLSYVFNIINKFEGDISVKSELNEGSTFTIKLPVNNG